MKKHYSIPFAISLLASVLVTQAQAAKEINSLDNRIYRCDQVFKDEKSVSAMLILGNSNVVSGDIPAQDGVTNAVGISPINGLCYPAKDPLMGTVGTPGSPWTRIANQLIANKSYEGVLLIPVMSPNSSIADWKQDGKIFKRIQQVTSSLMKQGITISSVVWQHEQKKDAALPQTSEYAADFADLTQGLRKLGINAPIYVAKMGACAGHTDSPFYEAQKNLVSEKDNILNGPDLMSLKESDFVAGGCTLNKDGLETYVSSWVDVLKK